MTDTDVLIHILDYLNDFENDLYCKQAASVSDEFKLINSAKIAAISEVINYIEDNLGMCVRTFDE